MSELGAINNINTTLSIPTPNNIKKAETKIEETKAPSLDSTLSQTVSKGTIPASLFKSEPEYKTEVLKNDEAKVTIEFPQFTNLENKEAQNKINAYFKANAETTLANSTATPTEETEGDIMDGGVSFNSSVGTVSSTSNTLSVTTADFSYFEGAANGNSMIAITNFDLKTGNQIELKDLFKNDSKHLDKISKYVTEKLTQELGEFLIPESVAPDSENFKNFTIKDNALEFKFNTYDVSTSKYAPTVSIPLELLKDDISPTSVLADKVK